MRDVFGFQRPEPVMSVSIVQSELVCSEPSSSDSAAEISSLRLRVAELEEAVSRANAELLVSSAIHRMD
jgi:hypothetical protein